MEDKIRCPIPVKGRECGLEAKPEKMLYLGMQRGGIAYHHECEFHKFHIICSDKGETTWKECDCKK